MRIRHGHMVVAVLLAGAGGCSERGEPLIEIRLVQQDSAAGYERAGLDGEFLYLAPETVIADSDLRRVRASSRGSQLFLELELTAAATERLETVSREQVGSRMAFILDARVRSAPVVESAVGSPLHAAVDVADAVERERLLERIRARWPDGGDGS